MGGGGGGEFGRQRNALVAYLQNRQRLNNSLQPGESNAAAHTLALEADMQLCMSVYASGCCPSHHATPAMISPTQPQQGD